MGRPAADVATTTESDPEQLARDWIGYAMDWARAAEFRRPGLDYEQIAIDALDRAIRRHDPARGEFFWFLRRCLFLEARNRHVAARGRRRIARMVPLSGGVPAVEPATPPRPDPLELAEVSGALAGLPEREAAVLRAVCLEGKQQSELADEWGVSKQRVGQLYAAGRGRMRAIFDGPKGGDS